MADLRAIVVTVHGTWARGAPWAKADLRLARAVVQWFAGRGVTATVAPFQWSGRNSVAARRAAGATLADCLDTISSREPRTSLYVIAHSHGGSVFGYTAKLRPDIVDKVDGFIALATPWIGIEPCSYAMALRKMLIKLTLYAALAAMMLPLTLLFIYLITGEIPSIFPPPPPPPPPIPFPQVGCPEFEVPQVEVPQIEVPQIETGPSHTPPWGRIMRKIVAGIFFVSRIFSSHWMCGLFLAPFCVALD